MSEPVSGAKLSPTGAIRGVVAAWAISVLLGALLLVGCGDRTTSPAAGEFTPRTRGVLTVATTDIPTPGFWTGTPEHVTGGLEYELARDLAQRFGLKSVSVRIVHFHRIVGGDLGGADLALDLITPTAQREQVLDFSDPYLDGAPTLVVRNGTSVADLATARTLRWGAVRATTFVSIINTLVDPDTPARIYDNTSEMLAGLEARSVDAVLLDMPFAVATANESQGRLQAVAQLPGSETIAAALPKGSGNVEAVDSAMRAFTADGTIEHLLRTWIGPQAADAEKSIPLIRSTR
ncbi:MAG TPA: ABC transporter substrate-binding protein [Solirubrobacteraceae bacterium]